MAVKVSAAHLAPGMRPAELSSTQQRPAMQLNLARPGYPPAVGAAVAGCQSTAGGRGKWPGGGPYAVQPSADQPAKGGELDGHHALPARCAVHGGQRLPACNRHWYVCAMRNQPAGQLAASWSVLLLVALADGLQMRGMRAPSHGPPARPPTHPPEYCERGALSDVLFAAKHSPQRAAELTWARRLSLVRAW